MLWSLIKIFLFLAIAVALAYGATYILETPGGIQIEFGDRRYELTPIGFVLSIVALLAVAWLILKLAGLILAVFHFLMGDETAISRYFNRNRERRGFNALSDGMVAIAAGDPKTAVRQTAKAEKLLDRPEITRLVSAQAHELSGDADKATSIYKEMLAQDRTRFVGIKGLMEQRLAAGDTDTALALARKANALRPSNERVLRTLFDLQTKNEDWAGARQTLNASVNARLLPRDVGARRDAVLSLADARQAYADDNAARAREAALQANKLAPTLIPAAVMASEAHLEARSKRRAIKTLTACWAANPHPDLAAAFAKIEPDETPAARRARFGTLAAAKPDDPESKLLLAELALADEDFPGARKALGGLAETAPTTRSLAIMAAIERGQGAPESVVRGWLAKSLNASRGPQWVCTACNDVHDGWEPVCSNCNAFDTLTWKTPPHAENSGLAQSAMLPLIVGALEDARTDAAAASEVEDAQEIGAEARTA